MRRFAPSCVAAGFLLACHGALALDTAQWPPPSGVEAHMRELQSVLASRDATAAERQAAREQLSNLLKSPAGQLRGRTPDEKPARPPRAAIDPLPSMVKPLPAQPAFPAPPMARLDVIAAPKPLVLPSGSVTLPSNGFAIDGRTGSVLHEIPGGFIDPRTGLVTPR